MKLEKIITNIQNIETPRPSIQIMKYMTCLAQYYYVKLKYVRYGDKQDE